MLYNSQERLAALSEIKQAAKRGIELEAFVAEVFRQLHFQVDLNPGAARPRQTDILAVRSTEAYLIECKWRSDKANIDDLDSLRSRLRRTSGTVVGLLISVPGFSGTVLHDIEHNRAQPILLISGDELRSALRQPDSLLDLLWRKKDALLTDGRVLLDEPAEKRPKQRRLSMLPRAERYFLFPDQSRRQFMECEGTFGQFVFAHELPDIDWVLADGYGVTLDVAPQIRDQQGLLDLIGKLANLGWATPDARWSIQQTRRNWHGFGSAAFAEKLPEWQQRAKSPGAHHSEEFTYLDLCDGGFYTLVANLAAHRTRQTLAVNLSFQLEGIPLDSGPLLQLCRSVGVHENLYFRPRIERSVDRTGMGDLQLETPIAYVVAEEDDPSMPYTHWVTGIVIANPLKRQTAKKCHDHPTSSLALLMESEYLIYDLAQHHPVNDRELSYHLRGFERVRTSDATVYRPVADWKRATVDPPDSSEMAV